jgi:hypothetical protein
MLICQLPLMQDIAELLPLLLAQCVARSLGGMEVRFFIYQTEQLL